MPRWQVTGLIVATVVLLAAVIWYLMGGFGVDRPPFEQRLEEIAEARGIAEEDAISMIVNGFCKEVFRELPMEFAVEGQKLLGISLEGAVG